MFQNNTEFWINKIYTEAKHTDGDMLIYWMRDLEWEDLVNLIEAKLTLTDNPSKNKICGFEAPRAVSHKNGYFCFYSERFTVFKGCLRKDHNNAPFCVSVHLEDIDDGDNNFFKGFESEEEAQNMYDKLLQFAEASHIIDCPALQGFLFKEGFKN